MAPPVDKDLLFLEGNIALVDDLYQLADDIITATEDPDVIIIARQQQRVAALLEKKLRDYWPRLQELRTKKERPAGQGEPITKEEMSR